MPLAWLVPYVAASLIGFTVYRRRRVLAFVVGLAAIAYPFVALVSLDLEREHTPVLYDATLARIDGATGRAVIHAARRTLRWSRLLRGFAKWVYDWNLPIALLLAAFAKRQDRLALALGLAGALGLVCYAIVPAVGPGASPGDYRNAMPSVHFAVTLIVLAALWRVGSWARAYAVAFVAITVLATLGFGEHYVVDLLAAIPYAALMWFGAKRLHHAAVSAPTE